MNKTQLVEQIALQTGIRKVDARKCVDALIQATATALQQGEKITLTGLGTFSVSKTKGRIGRHPRTGASIRIAPRNAVRFRPGSDLTALVQ